MCGGQKKLKIEDSKESNSMVSDLVRYRATDLSSILGKRLAPTLSGSSKSQRLDDEGSSHRVTYRTGI